MAVTLRVESENWLAALKVGLQKMGTGDLASDVLCDIQEDGSIHVTDSATGRVFRIRELGEPSPAAPPAPVRASPPPRAPAAPERPAARPAASAPPEPAAARPAAPAPASRPAVPAPRAAGPAPAEARPAASPPAARPRPSGLASKIEEVSSPGVPPGKIGRSHAAPRREEVLEEVFLRVAGLHASRTREEGLRFLLDLAMEKIKCESGSVFLSELGSGDLSFAVARGPKAAEILRLGLRVPMGVGIVGFCALENVCLAVSDVEKDPRFYRAISQALGYSTRSLLCTPIASRGRVHGALELVNKLGERPFDQADLAILSYLSFQAGEFLDRVEA
jgi:hypothetical protein